MALEAVIWRETYVKVLDQLLLPLETKYIKVNDVEMAWYMIKNMQVRGAPAIAIVGCLSLAAEIQSMMFSSKKDLYRHICSKLDYLLTARPTAVNLKTAATSLGGLAHDFYMTNTIDIEDMKSRFINAAVDMLHRDKADNKMIGENGANDILNMISHYNRINILTHCNTGTLATAGYGTALGVIRSLHQRNRLNCVYCTETRPYLQGARLTAYELIADDIPMSLICDSMVSALMKEKRIAAVIVGADRIAANGDTANKIGTYQIAVVAKYHDVPFFVAATRSTIDLEKLSGDNITIEMRAAEEMTSINGIKIAPSDVRCWNPSFDVTPANLITGIITEHRVYQPKDLAHSLVLTNPKKGDIF